MNTKYNQLLFHELDHKTSPCSFYQSKQTNFKKLSNARTLFLLSPPSILHPLISPPPLLQPPRRRRPTKLDNAETPSPKLTNRPNTAELISELINTRAWSSSSLESSLSSFFPPVPNHLPPHSPPHPQHFIRPLLLQLCQKIRIQNIPTTEACFVV